MNGISPSLLHLKKDTNVPKDVEVGVFLQRVTADNNEDLHLTFSLAPNNPPGPLPFAINASTGDIYVNESLANKVIINLIKYKVK